MTNTLKLKALIMEHGFTQEEVAKRLGISAQSMNAKINNKREFKASEITIMIDLLKITDISAIFFNQKVS